jgi:hypothetical protein
VSAPVVFRLACAAAALVTLSSCADHERPFVPRPKNMLLVPISGDEQFALPGTALEDSLQVRLIHRETGESVAGVEIVWSLVAGDGVELSPQIGISDAAGYVSAALTVGPPGETIVRAAFDGIWGDEPRFVAFSTERPQIHSVHPLEARLGDTLEIRGINFFAAKADHNVVRFGGMRAEVVSASATELRAVLPRCLPSRDVAVTVALGPVVSAEASIRVEGEPVAPVQLQPGEAIRLAGPDAARCLTLPGDPARSSYLVIPQNVEQSGMATPFQLVGVSHGDQVGASMTWPDHGSATGSAAASFEARLRELQRELLERRHLSDETPPPLLAPMQASVAPPIGHARTFAAVDINFQAVRVEAALRAVGRHSLVYQDVRAPADGYDAADFQQLADVFDDPIHATIVERFGDVSDVDGNGRVIILLTAAVNEMTPADANGYIAGFFNPCDLLPDLALNCVSNAAEIFYALVPDPSGVFGKVHSTESALRATIPALAHEYQHMVHFNQRGLLLNGGLDELWLMEGLAHLAEDLVGDVFRARGNEEMVDIFYRPNAARAALYLRDPAAVSLFAPSQFGTLEERGVAWLFMGYLYGRFGADVLRRLSHTRLQGVHNVDMATGDDWRMLLADFAIALHVQDTTETGGLALDPRYSFGDLDLRDRIGRVLPGAYPLQTLWTSPGDFLLGGRFAPGSGAFVGVRLDDDAINLLLTGARGIPLTSDAARQITVFRLN